MPIGPLELLLILFCCAGLFGLPAALLLWYFLRKKKSDEPREPQDLSS